MHSQRISTLVISVCIALFLGNSTSDFVAAAIAENQVDFAREVKPLFARKCFACHGPETAESGLALHEARAAFHEADSGLQAIVPGNADESELWRRISSDDESERMPPEGKPLSKNEVAAIRQWIDEGAKWEKHWAFVPIAQQVPPEVQQVGWVRNDVDRFIYQLA